MKFLNKQTAAALLSVAMLMIAIPAVAQIDNGLTFDAPFAFRAGKATLPAGTYRVTKPNDTEDVLLIANVDGSAGAFVDYRSVDKNLVGSDAKVDFIKTADTTFLNRISLPTEQVVIVPLKTKAESKAARAAKNSAPLSMENAEGAGN